MKLIRFVSAAMGLSFTLAMAFVCQAQIVTNGTFGTTGSPSTSGWTTSGTGTPGFGITAIQFQPAPSDQYGDNIPMDGTINTGAYLVDDAANETLSQSITLAANQNYQLSFDLLQPVSGANNPGGFTLYDSLGTAIGTINDISVPVNAWTTETLDFVSGAAGAYTLAYNFQSGPTPAKDAILTNVAVNATPEPSSLVLLGSGLLGFAGVARRRFSR